MRKQSSKRLIYKWIQYLFVFTICSCSVYSTTIIDDLADNDSNIAGITKVSVTGAFTTAGGWIGNGLGYSFGLDILEWLYKLPPNASWTQTGINKAELGTAIGIWGPRAAWGGTLAGMAIGAGAGYFVSLTLPSWKRFASSIKNSDGDFKELKSNDKYIIGGSILTVLIGSGLAWWKISQK